jgi:hypothetical protein
VTWFKIDDHITEHPKTQALSGNELALYIESLAYCSRNLTDGRFPLSEVGAWARRRRMRTGQAPTVGLINAKCWRRVNRTTLEVVDYLQHQRSRSSVQNERGRALERQRRHRDVTP